MRLKQPFLKLPIRFDADALAAEVRALPAAAWVPHPGHIPGNEAVPLITPNGTPTDALAGPMAATEHLKSCEYVQQIMAEVGGVWGRSRFMGLAAGAAVPLHIDINYYWRTHLRIHIPVITNPEVLFTCGDETIHMAPGECWIFDSFRWHEVHNKGSEQRVHLVLDTVGGGLLPQLMKDAEADTAQPRRFAPGSGKGKGLLFERVNSPKVMSPWEIRCHIAFIREHAGADPKVLAKVRLGKGLVWRCTDDGLPIYERRLTAAEVRSRIERCWRPYHAALREELDRMRAAHGRVVLWEGHSIRGGGLPFLFEGRLPDLNLGTANGASCSAALQARIEATLASQPDYDWVANGRFKGGHITRHYADPGNRIEAIQLEISQRTYMDEESFEYDEAKAAALQPLLRTLLETTLA